MATEAWRAQCPASGAQADDPREPWSDDAIAAIDRALAAAAQEDAVADPAAGVRLLRAQGLDRLPLPGGGRTLERWRLLARVGWHDLSVAKLFEAHADAQAILHELGAPDGVAGEDLLWGVWCAEPPDARLACRPDSPREGGAGVRRVRLRGRKAWCSGAQGATHALVGCWDAEGRYWLAAVDLGLPGVRVTADGWQAVGMGASGSVDVWFDDAPASLVGPPGAYMQRPGFLHGGAGVAACWMGAAARLGQRLLSKVQGHLQKNGSDGSAPFDPHALAHLGALDISLNAARSALQEAAAAIDARPLDGCAVETARARLAVEAAAQDVLQRASRALGAAPLCREAGIARLMADLPVFIRQSHAERDLAGHGLALARHTTATAGRQEHSPWTL